tara:strand:+ start:5136 stop:5837 length:702 start_codon:yes stop_codon:yes gene_type:complete
VKPKCTCGKDAWASIDISLFRLCVESITTCKGCGEGRWREHLHHACAVNLRPVKYNKDGSPGSPFFPHKAAFCRYQPLNLVEGTVSVEVGDDFMKPVTALVEGGLAMYSRGVHDWRVAHKGSGALIAKGIRAKWRAKKLMSHLLPLLDWREPEGVIFKLLFKDPDLALLIAMIVERATSRALTDRSKGRPVKRKKRKRIRRPTRRRLARVRGMSYEEWKGAHGLDSEEGDQDE